MKIFMYAQGRSGGNTIQKALAETLNLTIKWIPEFDKGSINKDAFDLITKEDNIIVKLHLWQKVDIFDTQIEFLRYIYKNFDTVIYHGRGNSLETGLSLHNGIVRPKIHWTTTKYTPTIKRPDLNYVRNASIRLGELILLSKTFDSDVTFYEEIFSGKPELTIETINRWNIDSNLLSYNILLEKFDPKGKYTNKAD
jgi:hypothetical protein